MVVDLGHVRLAVGLGVAAELEVLEDLLVLFGLFGGVEAAGFGDAGGGSARGAGSGGEQLARRLVRGRVGGLRLVCVM